ncbi:zdhhc15 [Symbiodinium sp. CCMP2456]|nr:zdhhc15 [Symbiodinium sp. CCMP2456]
MFGLKKVTQCILAALFLLALHSMWSGRELLKMQGVTEDTVEAAPFPNEASRSTAPPPQCSSDYFAPRQAKLFAGPLFDSRKNKQRYKAFRAEFEMYTGRDPLHTFNVVKFQTGGIQYTDLHNSHDHKTLVLGCKDKALRESTNWTNWYYAPTGPTDFSTCETIIPGTAVFFRGMSFGRFIYGALLHDILPPVLWMYDNEPNATPVFEIEKSGKVVDFMKWFDPALHSRALYVPAGKTVCAESLLVMVPHRDIVHPAMVLSVPCDPNHCCADVPAIGKDGPDDP